MRVEILIPTTAGPDEIEGELEFVFRENGESVFARSDQFHGVPSLDRSALCTENTERTSKTFEFHIVLSISYFLIDGSKTGDRYW